MKVHRLISSLACAALLIGSTAALAQDASKPEVTVLPRPAAATTQPATTQPAATEPAATTQAAATIEPAPTTVPAKADISPEAQKLIDEVAGAYIKLKSLQLEGTLVGEFEADGRKEGGSLHFATRFEAPNKFVHQSKDGEKEAGIIGSTGEKAYLYDKGENGYLQDSAPKEKVATKDLPKPFPAILSMQDPSLRLALAKDPGVELTDFTTAIAKGEDARIGDATFPTLKVTNKDGGVSTIAIDPASHLIRQTITDMRAAMEKRGVPDVKKALYTIDYTSTTPDAAVKAEQFAWAPPQGAHDLKANAGGGDDSPATALVGKVAPPFSLKGLDGKEITLADLKGKVVVLDFWATWCPPCRASLPHLDKFYQENKAAGVQVFAVNQAEEKDKVQGFVDSSKLGVPVLLDSNGKVGEAYLANAIPETVVIGKDGKVIKVFIGFDPENTPGELKKAAEEGMKN